MLAALIMRSMQKRRMVRNSIKDKKEECCRTCLSNEGLQPIFTDYTDSQPINLMNLSQYLQIASGLKIMKNDGLSQKICNNCIQQIYEVIKFKKMCKKSERTLMKINSYNTPIVTAKPLTKKNKIKPRLITVKKQYNKKRNKINYINDHNDFDDHFNNDDNTHNDNKVEINAHNRNNDLNNKVNVKSDIVHVPFSLKCNICERVMKNKHTYLRHMVVHTGEYPFMCEQCGKGLMAYTHLVTHMKANHGWERTDKCSYCGYLALNKSILQIHERIHTGEKPFVCDHCGMGFHRRANLLQHLPIHSTVKTAQCSLCPSSFKSVRFLRTHHNKKHKQVKYTYVCDICKNYFKTCGNVRLHMSRIHSVPKEEQGPVTRILISDAFRNRI